MTRCAGPVLGMTLLAALAAEAVGQEPKWTDVSAPVLGKLQEENLNVAWPGGTAGVVVNPADGDVFMIVPGQGIWKSTDQGASFFRADNGTIGGRCETSYSLQFDPAGGRIACFMLDGKCGMTADGGKSWSPFTDLGRNWDYAAVHWTDNPVKHILGARHETGGEVFLSSDGGKTWSKLFDDPEFERTGGLGIFDGQTFVYTMKGKGIQRSTDAGKNWSKISDLEPWGRVARVRDGVGYWLHRDGLRVSRDKGATWTKQGTGVEATIGPFFDPKDDAHLAAAGKKGIFESKDGGATWKHLAALPEKFDLPKPGWFSNVAWDPARGLFYASRMGQPTYRLNR